jgi:hypothetical protein
MSATCDQGIGCEVRSEASAGTGVICARGALQVAAIPAQARIYSANLTGGGSRAWVSLAWRALLCKYAFMRTTVDLPDPLFRQVKSVAALKGSTLKEFIQEALERAVTGDRGVRHKVRLPLIHSKHPGTLRLTNADIEDHLARH